TEIVAIDQPKSCRSGLISTPGVARNPAAPTVVTKATAATIQARCSRAVRCCIITVTDPWSTTLSGIDEWPDRQHMQEAGHDPSAPDRGPRPARRGRVRPRGTGAGVLRRPRRWRAPAVPGPHRDPGRWAGPDRGRLLGGTRARPDPARRRRHGDRPR